MWTLFVTWGDGQVTQTQFGSLELAEEGMRQLSQHRSVVSFMPIQTHAPKMLFAGEWEEIPEEDLEPGPIEPIKGGRRGRKG